VPTEGRKLGTDADTRPLALDDMTKEEERREAVPTEGRKLGTDADTRPLALDDMTKEET
jgi:hypothetical protein